MRARSVRSSRSVCSRGGRFIASRLMLQMCCSGMSMYLHTCAGEAHVPSSTTDAIHNCWHQQTSLHCPVLFLLSPNQCASRLRAPAHM